MTTNVKTSKTDEEYFLNITHVGQPNKYEVEQLKKLLCSEKISRDVVNQGLINLACIDSTFVNQQKFIVELLEFILEGKYGDVNAERGNSNVLYHAINNCLSLALTVNKQNILDNLINNQNDIVKLLLEHGANVNGNNTQNNNRLPLNLAIKANNTEIVKLLLENGANANGNNTQDSKNLPLIIAIRSNNNEAVKLLLENGANVDGNNTQDSENLPLIIAIRSNNNEAVKLLLENGATVDGNNTQDSENLPLIIAIRSNNNEAVKLLLENGANVDGDKIQSKLILPLSIAIQVNNKEAYDLLINKVSEIEDFNDENGYFSIAIKYNNEYALSDLLKNHKNKLKVSIDDFMMSNFLHLNENILKLLVKFGGKEKFLETKLIEIARKYSEYLKLLNNKDTTIDQYKECFYQSKEFTKELKKACQDDFNLNQIQQKIFSQDGKELISEIIKETRQSQCEFNFYQIMKQIFIHQRKLISEIIKETPQTDHKDLVKWLTLFGVKFSFHNLDKILLSSQPSMNESKNYPKDLDGAFINLKKMSKVKIKDGKLYNDHTGDIINGSEDQELLYVVDKKGQLYINVNKYDAPVHHSFILNGYNKKHTLEGISMFGYGKPAACGGHLKIKDGIITKINNDSGHYAPNQDMLTQVCHELLNEKVLDPNFLLTDYTNKPISLSNLNVEEVIVTGEYLFLDY